MVTAYKLKECTQCRCGIKLLAFHQRPQEIAKDQLCGVRVFRTVEGRFPCNAFAPTDHAVHVGFHEDDAADFAAVHTGFEWGHQFHGNFAKSDFSNEHSCAATTPFLKVAPWSEKVRAVPRAGAQSDRSITFVKPFRELFPQPRLNSCDFW